MRRHIPGLRSGHQDLVSNLDGLFLVRIERASHRWHPRKPILEPTSDEALSFLGRLYCSERALWKFSWFLRDFGYDAELLIRDQDWSARSLRRDFELLIMVGVLIDETFGSD